MKIKMFDSHNIEQRRERRLRIRNSRDLLVIINFEESCRKALRLPSCEFDAEKYRGLIYLEYGGEFIIFPDWKYTPEQYKYFVNKLQNDEIFYSVLYKDLDGKTAQTHFKRL